MCVSPSVINVRKCGQIVGQRTVPCGRCAECVRKRQNDAFQVFYDASLRFDSLVFSTFTYSDDFLPYQLTQLSESPDSCDRPERLCKSFIRGQDFESVHNKIEALNLLDQDSFFECLPSLCRKDWRLWLKSARVAFKRSTGSPLPKFSYITVGEYGLSSYRPHYHTLFLGLSFSVVQRLCSSWNYGFTFSEPVQLSSSSRVSVCRYLAKYLYKGSFDFSAVQAGFVEAPRVMSSIGLCQFSSDFSDYLTGKDLGLSLDQPFLSDELCRRLLERRTVLVDNKSFPVSSKYVRKIFKRAESRLDDSSFVSYRNTPLQNALSDYVQRSSSEIYSRQFERVCRSSSCEEISENIGKFCKVQKISLEDREKTQSARSQRFYSRSKF